jgi:hypothetical protein
MSDSGEVLEENALGNEREGRVQKVAAVNQSPQVQHLRILYFFTQIMSKKPF